MKREEKEMSFSSRIKQELNKNSNLSNKEMIKNELIGYFISENTSVICQKVIKFSTENDYNINRFSKLLSNLEIDHKIEISGKTFIITLKAKDVDFVILKQGEIDLTWDKNLNEENKKAIIRGVFMGAGFVNNPEKEYHLEVDLKTKQNVDKLVQLLQQMGIRVKVLLQSIYIKEGEEISKFLALMGANKAVMQFEEIRIQKEMRGKVNRLVNCKTANLNKTINASIEQISAIQKLQKTGRFNKLDENLKEIAVLRMKNPDMPLAELGKLLKEPIGKSGVNYRLKKIMEIANGE